MRRQFAGQVSADRRYVRLAQIYRLKDQASAIRACRRFVAPVDAGRYQHHGEA
jgi:hypothetical protein